MNTASDEEDEKRYIELLMQKHRQIYRNRRREMRWAIDEKVRRFIQQEKAKWRREMFGEAERHIGEVVAVAEESGGSICKSALRCQPSSSSSSSVLPPTQSPCAQPLDLNRQLPQQPTSSPLSPSLLQRTNIHTSISAANAIAANGVADSASASTTEKRQRKKKKKGAEVRQRDTLPRKASASLDNELRGAVFTDTGLVFTHSSFSYIITQKRAFIDARPLAEFIDLVRGAVASDYVEEKLASVGTKDDVWLAYVVNNNCMYGFAVFTMNRSSLNLHLIATVGGFGAKLCRTMVEFAFVNNVGKMRLYAVNEKVANRYFDWGLNPHKVSADSTGNMQYMTADVPDIRSTIHSLTFGVNAPPTTPIFACMLRQPQPENDDADENEGDNVDATTAEAGVGAGVEEGM